MALSSSYFNDMFLPARDDKRRAVEVMEAKDYCQILDYFSVVEFHYGLSRILGRLRLMELKILKSKRKIAMTKRKQIK